MPVGKGDKMAPFTLHTIESKPGDSLYLYSDRYADQFGGAQGKKFKYKTLFQLLVAICNEPLNVQFHKLDSAFENWKGNLEQVDDVCLIGIKLWV